MTAHLPAKIARCRASELGALLDAHARARLEVGNRSPGDHDRSPVCVWIVIGPARTYTVSDLDARVARRAVRTSISSATCAPVGSEGWNSAGAGLAGRELGFIETGSLFKARASRPRRARAGTSRRRRAARASRFSATGVRWPFHISVWRRCGLASIACARRMPVRARPPRSAPRAWRPSAARACGRRRTSPRPMRPFTTTRTRIASRAARAEPAAAGASAGSCVEVAREQLVDAELAARAAAPGGPSRGFQCIAV